MRARAWLVVPLLGGCNQLLGLDATSRATDAGTTSDADTVDSGNVGCPEPGDVGFADEDSDTIDDRCDNCPANANLEQGDGDLDDVGDTCDPSETPTRIAFFDGFHDGDLAGWQQSGVSSWRATGDAAVLENGTGISVLLVDGLDIDSGRVVAPVEIISLPTAVDHQIGVAFSAFQLDGYLCVADEMGTTTSAQAVLYVQTAGTPTPLSSPAAMSGAFVNGALLSADARWGPGGQTCSVELGATAIVTAFDSTYPSGSAGIYAQGAEVRVPYVIVYEDL